MAKIRGPRHVLYDQDNINKRTEGPIQTSTLVEILLNGEWVGGYEVRRVRSDRVTVIDRAEGFFSKLIDVPHGRFRLPELPDPIMRDDAGNMWRA